MDERSPSLVKKIEEIRDGKEIERNQFFNPPLPDSVQYAEIVYLFLEKRQIFYPKGNNLGSFYPTSVMKGVGGCISSMSK